MESSQFCSNISTPDFFYNKHNLFATMNDELFLLDRSQSSLERISSPHINNQKNFNQITNQDYETEGMALETSRDMTDLPAVGHD
jgi:hypothetical protein